MNMRDHLNGPEHLCNFVSFLLCVSQSVFGTIQRRLACRCADVDTRQSRSAVKFCVAQFLRFLCLLPVLMSREGILLVVGSLVSRCET